ncbi:MAG TPA: hypothetical protein VD963_06060, partial [Phycisphaerales bacterium]|nr:hypothetical protein [Phycisphaerales bacterium]
MSQQTDQGAGWGRVGSARADEARRVERRLAGLRRRMKALLVGERGLRLVAVLVGAALLVGLADYLLRAPAWVRLGVWVAGAAAAAWWARRLLGPVLAFRPRLADVALRLEESPAGRAAQLPGVLAAGYEFAAQAPGLTDRVVSTAAARLERLRAGAVTDVGRLGRAAALAVLALAAVTALGVAWPALTAIGARRVLAPWSGAEWPRRTELADVTGVSVHPLGTALPLRAALVRTPGRPESARVWARYRVDHGEGFGPAQRVLLTGQDRQASVPPSAAEANQQTTGLLFERLIEPAAVPGPAGTPGAPQAPAAEVEYWFEAGDDRTDPARVALVTPPLVVGARAVVTPPAYVGAALGAPAGAPRELDLGSGTDERAAPPGLLQGSRVELTIELNKPVPGPVPGPGGVPQTAWLESAFGAEAARALVEAGAEFRAGPRSWALGWTLGAPVRLLVTVTDEHGLSSAGAGDQAVYRFEPVADAPPTAAVIRPDADRTVLPSAVVELAGEARDDIAVGAAELQQRVARRPAGSGGAPAEPDPQWAAVRGQVR